MTLKTLSAEEEALYHYTPSPEKPWKAGARRTYVGNVSLRRPGSPGSPYQKLHGPSFLVEAETPEAEETKSPGPETPRTRKIRFGSIHKRTYFQPKPSREEKSALWYSGKEIKDMRTAIFALNMSCASLNPRGRAGLVEVYAQSDSWRGLEHVREGSLLRKVRHRKDFSKAFLYFSRELGVSNPNALAVFSSTNSKVDAVKATEVAKEDALEACRIYYEFLTLERNTPEAKAAERDGQRRKQSTPKGRRQRRQSQSTPRHHADKKPLQPQVLNLTLAL